MYVISIYYIYNIYMHYLMEYIYIYTISDGKINQSYMYKLVSTFCQNYNFKFT